MAAQGQQQARQLREAVSRAERVPAAVLRDPAAAGQCGLAAPGNGESDSQDTGQGQKLFAEKWQIRAWRERSTTAKPYLGCHKLVRSKSRLSDQLLIFIFLFFLNKI